MILAVVITYKAPEKLAACLASFAGQTEVFVCDNSENNLLYTKGINVGIRKALEAKADYVLIVCDDVLIRPDAIKEMTRFLEENPTCAIAAPIQVAKSGEVTCGGCTDAFPYGRHIVAPLETLQKEEPYESFWANGACFLLRTEAARECGLLDENMRFICSDSDYSFTLRARGWKIFIVPSALVEHEPDGALNFKNTFIERTKDEDALYFMEKWLLGTIFLRLSAEGSRLSSADVTNQLSALRSRLAQEPAK